MFSSLKKALLFGFLLWFFPLMFSFAIFQVHEKNLPLFESLIAIVLTGSTILFNTLYIKEKKKNFLPESILLSLLWVTISLFFDVMIFIIGPLKMPIGEYVADIGLTYLLIPIVIVGQSFYMDRFLFNKKFESKKEVKVKTKVEEGEEASLDTKELISEESYINLDDKLSEEAEKSESKDDLSE